MTRTSFYGDWPGCWRGRFWVRLPFMKWLVGFLGVINAALFLWATGHDADGLAPASAYPVVNAENMRLLHELAGPEQGSEDSRNRCARIGPFVDSAVAALAGQKLDALSLSYSRRTIKSREIRAYRVFLGPFETRAGIEAQRRLLQAGDIEDFYLKRDEQGVGIISLGLFSQRDGAELLADRLSRLDIQAKIRPEDRTLKPSFWLEIDDPSVARQIPPELAEARWGERRARLRRYECP